MVGWYPSISELTGQGPIGGVNAAFETQIAATPLPPAWTMMLIGLADFGFYRRKSKPATGGNMIHDAMRHSSSVSRSKSLLAVVAFACFGPVCLPDAVPRTTLPSYWPRRIRLFGWLRKRKPVLNCLCSTRDM